MVGLPCNNTVLLPFTCHVDCGLGLKLFSENESAGSPGDRHASILICRTRLRHYLDLAGSKLQRLLINNNGTGR